MSELGELVARKRKLRELVSSGRARELRKASDISGDELAACLGVTHDTIYRWELGKKFPPPGNLEGYLVTLEEMGADEMAPLLEERDGV